MRHAYYAVALKFYTNAGKYTPFFVQVASGGAGMHMRSTAARPDTFETPQLPRRCMPVVCPTCNVRCHIRCATTKYSQRSAKGNGSGLQCGLRLALYFSRVVLTSLSLLNPSPPVPSTPLEPIVSVQQKAHLVAPHPSDVIRVIGEFLVFEIDGHAHVRDTSVLVRPRFKSCSDCKADPNVKIMSARDFERVKIDEIVVWVSFTAHAVAICVVDR